MRLKDAKNSLVPCSFLLIVELKPFSSEVHPNCVSSWCCLFLLTLSGNSTVWTSIEVLFCITAAAKCCFIFQWVKQWKLGGQLFVLFEYWLSQSRLVAPSGNFFRAECSFHFHLPFNIDFFATGTLFNSFSSDLWKSETISSSTKSLCCAGSNFCGRQLSHLRLASCRLVSVL